MEHKGAVLLCQQAVSYSSGELFELFAAVLSLKPNGDTIILVEEG